MTYTNHLRLLPLQQHPTRGDVRLRPASLLRSAPRMDRQECRKRVRDGEEAPPAPAPGRRRHAEVAFEAAADGGEGPSQRPAGVFDLPWQKCRGGLGVASGGGVWELRDVFFRSLVDGRAAAIGVPGDRLSPPPSKRTLFDDVDAWLAAADDAEVDPLWRSVLEGPRPAA